jgi:hypothetical protein
MHAQLVQIGTFALLSALLIAQPAAALLNRTFVASTGINTGSCAVSAPCRTFAYALTQTVAGGEIVAIDSAGFGPVTIDRSVALIAPPGVYAGVSVFSGTGVTIAAGASDVVVLRGLVITGLGGAPGVSVSQAAAVHIEKCLVAGFAGVGGDGIDIVPSSPVNVFISDSIVRGNQDGILADGFRAPTSRLEVSRTRIQDGVAGVELINITRASIVDSLIGHNTAGIIAFVDATSSVNADIAIDRTALVDNTNDSIVASGTFPPRSVVNVSNATIAGNGGGITAQDGGFIRVMSSQIDGNTNGVSASGSGVVQSLKNNMCYGNGSACAFSGNIPLN